MSYPSRGLQQTESAIHTVLESLNESQDALVAIGEKLEDQVLKRYFLAESLQRAQFRGELETVLNQVGLSDLRESGATSGALQSVWAGLRFKSDGGDHVLLATAEQSECATEEAYLSAISFALPLPVRQLLSMQAMHIHESLDYIKTTRGRGSQNAA